MKLVYHPFLPVVTLNHFNCFRGNILNLFRHALWWIPAIIWIIQTHPLVAKPRVLDVTGGGGMREEKWSETVQENGLQLRFRQNFGGAMKNIVDPEFADFW